MSFILYMVCIAVAIFLGALLDRYVILSKRISELDKEEYEYPYIAYSSKAEAAELMSFLQDRFERFGVLRMYDIYVFSDLSAGPEDAKYGWREFPDFKIEQQSNGKWIFTIPEPKFLLEK